MGVVNGLLLAVLGVLITFAPVSAASLSKEELAAGLAQELNGNPYADEFKYSNKEFAGDFGDTEVWDGFFCDGYYRYNSQLSGVVREMKADVLPNQTVDVTANLAQIGVGLTGVYRSEWSLCAKLQASHRITIDSVDAKAIATIVGGEDGSSPKIKLRVVSTQFGHIHFAEIMPSWMEEWLTTQVNKTLRYVWNSRLGDWISAWLTEKLNEKFPGGGEN